MTLSEEQKQTIAQRLADGAKIADIQRLVNEEFQIPMTYMETRFLIDDLNLQLAEDKPKEPEANATDEESDTELPAQDADAELVDAGGPAGSISVDVDKVKRPGAAMSGSVTFSDGQKAAWFVDPYGRLGLDPETEGYQPEPEDIEAFQVELQKQLQGPGI